MEDYKKKYEEALERAKCYKGLIAEMGIVFPELKESEDERMRKQLLNWFKDCSWDTIDGGKLKREDIIAWFEKQGKETQDPCEKCNHPMLNCCNLPCIQKRDFEQGKTVFDVMNEEKVDNWNCIKSAWSEEDEKMWAQVINEIEAIKSNSSTLFEKNIAQDKIDWLKSLKERVQPKQEWSEEDEIISTAIYESIDFNCLKSFGFSEDDVCDWIKSLHSQPHWKPSKEQMYILEWLTTNVLDDGPVGKKAKAVLSTLIERLKSF